MTTTRQSRKNGINNQVKQRKDNCMRTLNLIRTGALLALSASTSISLAQTPSPTNPPPAVRIVTPQEGAIFLAGAHIDICATTQSFTDTVATVEFFTGTNSLGVVTNHPASWGRDRDFACLMWSNAAAGPHTLWAKATDLAGNSVNSALVDITVVTNLPPRVSMVRPHNGATILGPTNLTLSAFAFDPDGTVASVTFFEGATMLGVVTNVPTVWVTNRYDVFPIRQTTYSLIWSNVAPGAYSLTAVAVDNGGATTTSAAVDITVVTNLPPQVRIVEPHGGATFFAPANIGLSAAASDLDGRVTGVKFFAGTNSLGVVTNSITVTNLEEEVQTLFSLTWSNVALGTYSLTAVATDNGGASTTSAKVNVAVTVRPPPSVRIVYPNNGATFVAPAKVYISTVTRYFTNPIASVQFLAGTNSLGFKTNSTWPTLLWSNVPPGAYSLTAVARDTAGTTATSAPVGITVLTNRPPHPHFPRGMDRD
jgi:hypothetical protein